MKVQKWRSRNESAHVTDILQHLWPYRPQSFTPYYSQKQIASCPVGGWIYRAYSNILSVRNRRPLIILHTPPRDSPRKNYTNVGLYLYLSSLLSLYSNQSISSISTMSDLWYVWLFWPIAAARIGNGVYLMWPYLFRQCLLNSTRQWIPPADLLQRRSILCSVNKCRNPESVLMSQPSLRSLLWCHWLYCSHCLHLFRCLVRYC